MAAYGGVDGKHAVLTSPLDTGGSQSSASRPNRYYNTKISHPNLELNYNPSYTDYTTPAHNVFHYTVKFLIPMGQAENLFV